MFHYNFTNNSLPPFIEPVGFTEELVNRLRDYMLHHIVKARVGSSEIKTAGLNLHDGELGVVLDVSHVET